MREKMTSSADLLDLVTRLGRYGRARNRDIDKEPRTISITDDEALLLLAEVPWLEALGYPDPSPRPTGR